MEPIGGYFSLELNKGEEFHRDALKLNAGRYALEYILKARRYRKIYLPYYICESVLEPVNRQHVEYEFYHLNAQLEPAVKLYPEDDEVVLYVNYFGLNNITVDTVCNSYHNTIIDQTQAFYSRQGNPCHKPDFHCDTFYSCRKFFGVADGAYLYTDCRLREEPPRDESFHRMTFLTKRIDRSPHEGYSDFRNNDVNLSFVGMRRMSHLTESIMSSIDYTVKANRRINNFILLDKVLRNTNLLKWDMDLGSVPLVYPYYVKHGSRLRQHLIDNQIFCARYWPNVLEWCKSSDYEYRLAENCVCLPIDQRYNENDMHFVLKIIDSFK